MPAVLATGLTAMQIAELVVSSQQWPKPSLVLTARCTYPRKDGSASKMTYIVSGGALNSTHSRKDGQAEWPGW